DSSGDALFAAVLGGAALVKPNLAELEAMADRSLPTIGAAIDAATELVGRGAGAVLVSLGPDGALYVDAAGAVSHAEAEIDDPVNTVGAGDALLAGFLAGGADAAALPEAVAWSVAAVRSPGTRMRRVSDADREQVIVHDTVDRGRRLRP
ncbi:MAG TPA: PfkB family carbohydrate kinase, partial [Candidatus Eisenbacteria bacterium]|nr:PfkB family carbohydrate kinase [Candidatus Eisenbacteria bacterium]